MVSLKHDKDCTANDHINILIVRGLLLIAAILWLGTFGLLYTGREVPDTIVQGAVGISAALAGYLSRSPDKGSSGSTGVSTQNVDTVNVESPQSPSSGPDGSQEGEGS